MDYRKIGDIQLPRAARRSRKDDELYPIEVIERVGERVKIHYVGYGNEDDEWRDASELVELQGSKKADAYVPFEFHKELAYHIKAALKSGNRQDPDVRIKLALDKLLFDGGLKQHGHFLCNAHGHEIFTICRYADLEHLLGEGWHIRGLNDTLDFCYINLKTVQFYLHERKGIEEYTLQGKKTIPGGWVLIL